MTRTMLEGAWCAREEEKGRFRDCTPIRTQSGGLAATEKRRPANARTPEGGASGKDRRAVEGTARTSTQGRGFRGGASPLSFLGDT